MTSPIRVPTTAGLPGLVREPSRHEPDDADRPRAVHEDGGGVRSAAHHDRSASGRASGAALPGPATAPGSGSPSASRASAIADRMRSRRVVLAASRRAASSAASSGVSASRSRARVERLPHPPGGVEPGREHEPDRLEIHGRRAGRGRAPAGPRCRAAGAVRIRSRPSRAIARFSPRIGTTSDTVPMVASSARSSASASAPGEVAEQEPGDRERDAAAGQRRVRVDRVRPVRVDDRDGRREHRGQVVMVGDDDVDAALAGRRDLGDARASPCRR